MNPTVRVRITRDTFDHQVGDVVDTDKRTAFAWVQADLAEFYGGRAKPAPRNKAKKPPRNKAKKPSKTKEE